MLGLYINGWTGRMGEAIRSLVQKDQKSFQLVGGRARKLVEGEPRVVTAFPKVPPKGTDVVVDFSLAEGWGEVLDWCLAHNLPLISGTTGLADAQLKAIQTASQSIPILWAPNMSLGVAVLAEALKTLKFLEGADFQIEEFHHNKKLDRPSGTALFLQQELENSLGKSVPQPVSIRGGGIFGVHRVYAMTEEETLTMEHQALNRQVFARGALVAARWLKAQSAGQYAMADVVLHKV